jgi:tRNA (Thr-GGU) A37 N-methylase
VFAKRTLHNGRPQCACAINETKIDATKSSRECVKELRELDRLIVVTTHDKASERSMTAAGVSAPGRGDAVVTNV